MNAITLKAIAMISLTLTLATAMGQDVKGTYIQQIGESGRTIEQEDGSEIHIMPLIYTETVLRIKMFHRVRVEESGMIEMKYSGRWKISGDTLDLHFGRETQRYLIRSNGNLHSVSNGYDGFTKTHSYRSSKW